MATQQTFNYRSLAACIKAIKDSLYYGELDNPEQIEYIRFEIPLELVKLDRNQTVILDNLNSNPYIIDRSYKEIKAIAKNISHAFNFFVKYPGQEKLEVSWCWDFNAMHVIYCEEEREKRFQEFMTAKKAKQVEQVTDTTLPTVSNTVKGRVPEYLNPLFILSSATYQTEDKTTSYRVATVNKSPNTATATESTFVVLDTNNTYRGFADSEYRVCELAELIIKKPTPEYSRRAN